MMTAKEMLPAIGQTVALLDGSLEIDVLVKDVKYSYGQPRLLVTPVSGSGVRWVQLSSVRLSAGVVASREVL